ncbi:MAG: hypothetical protein LBV16_08915 [Elusimicrobiota bacterium]|nr:hypothetical protein [Elusimicrobiota bacterium]
MAKTERRREPIYIKLYILLLFFLGIVIWFSMHSGDKQRVKIDIDLDNQISKVLSDNLISQDDIISQFAKEMQNKSSLWKEFNKKIILRDSSKLDVFDLNFRDIARSMNLGLNKILNADGSITYKFYNASDMTFSNITFMGVRSLGNRR